MFDRMSALTALIINIIIVVALIGWSLIAFEINASLPVFTIGMLIIISAWVVDAWMEA